jgi:hypothetical protein
VLRLAESAGLYDLVAEHVTVAAPNAVVKTTSVVAGMLAGADSIDDLDLLRHGAMGRLFAGVRALFGASGRAMVHADRPASATRRSSPRWPRTDWRCHMSAPVTAGLRSDPTTPQTR